MAMLPAMRSETSGQRVVRRTTRRHLMAGSTNSREYGSNGNAIARFRCERLGDRSGDKPLLVHRGEQLGLPADGSAPRNLRQPGEPAARAWSALWSWSRLNRF